MVYNREDRNKIVLENQNLVHMVLQKYCKVHIGHPDYEDLFQTGIEGLIRAIDHFDPNKGFKLSTYASSIIYGTIRRYRRDCLSPYGIRIPRPLRDKLIKVIYEDKEISEWNMGDYPAYLILTNQVSSLNHVISDEDNHNELQNIIEDYRSFSDFEEIEIQDCLDKFLESLQDEKHFDLIEEYMYDQLFSGGSSKTSRQDYLGKKYHMSQGQVSRIINKTLCAFKKFMER